MVGTRSHAPRSPCNWRPKARGCSWYVRFCPWSSSHLIPVRLPLGTNRGLLTLSLGREQGGRRDVSSEARDRYYT